MTPGGLCFQCREYTGRYDSEQRRWACRSCWPELLPWERELGAPAVPRRAPFDRTHQVVELRSIGIGKVEREVSEKLRVALRAQADDRRASQPWRRGGRR
jgi:hypothetical protein